MTNITCKYCNSENLVKTGFNSGLQRWRCKSCSKNFTEGDRLPGGQLAEDNDLGRPLTSKERVRKFRERQKKQKDI